MLRFCIERRRRKGRRANLRVITQTEQFDLFRVISRDQRRRFPTQQTLVSSSTSSVLFHAINVDIFVVLGPCYFARSASTFSDSIDFVDEQLKKFCWSFLDSRTPQTKKGLEYVDLSLVISRDKRYTVIDSTDSLDERVVVLFVVVIFRAMKNIRSTFIPFSVLFPAIENIRW